MLRVYVHPADSTGCGHYRIVWPAAIAHQQGLAQVSIATQIRARAKPGSDEIVDVSYPPDADVVVFQRLVSRRNHQIVKLLRQRGVAVVVDMDDDLSRINPANPAFRIYSPQNEAWTGQSWEHARQACLDATLVTVSTPALLSVYALHGRGKVLYNCVPNGYLQLAERHEDNDLVGWAGSYHSHPGDLQQLAPVLRRLGCDFRVIGPGDGVAEALGLSTERLSATGAVPMAKWASVISAGLGIGLAPLAYSKFNQAKSWLKMLEYASVGVPCIGSGLPEYQRLYREGVGLVANRPRDWERAIKTLQASPARRIELSQAGAEAARRWTVEANAWRWVEAWTEAVQIQRGRLPKKPAK